MTAKSKLHQFVIKPLINGLLGLFIFLLLILLMKALSAWIYGNEKVTIDIEDVMFSFVGFVLLFLIEFLSNFSSDR